MLFPTRLLPDVHADKAPPGVEVLTHAIDGGKVEAWLMLPKQAAPEGAGWPLLIFAHGNGELIDFWPEALKPYNQRGLAVLLVEYRGYGRSAGKPTEANIVGDFIDFYDQVTQRPDIDAAHVILHGRSIGGGIMAQLADRRRFAGLILESTFTSVPDVARSYLVPGFLIHDKLQVRRVIADFEAPMLIMHGLDDRVIPPVHALNNRAACPGSKLVLFDHMGHNDPPPHEPYWAAIDELLTQAGVPSTTDTPGPTMVASPSTRNLEMIERKGVVTLKGNPVTVLGPELKVGEKAPDFTLKANDMSDKTLADFAGKIKIISVVPSLDTPVCDTETRRFNQEAANLGNDVVILTVSVDTPMAQKRWCGAAGVDKVVTLSDFKDHSFGLAYGVRIKEVGLLMRAVFVLDRNDKIVYIQRVPEVAQEPDYAAVLGAAGQVH